MRKKILSLILLGILCSIGSVWGETFTINCETTTTDDLFPVSAAPTQYSYSSNANIAGWKLISMTTSATLTFTNTTGVAITAISAEGVAANNANKTVNFTISDGTTTAQTSSGSWNNRTSSSLTNKSFNSTNVGKLKMGVGQTYTITNMSSGSYAAGVRFVITYTPAPPADTEAPTLSTSNPANSATGIAVSGNITLTFSENVTINDATKFSITGGSLGTISASDNIVTIPYSGLAYSTEYTLSTAAGAVKDAANNTNAALSDISFTTKAATLYTVSFNAGSNGTCGTTSLTETSVGAGITLPSVTANTGYVFNGWYTASSEGDKVGDAGANYKPTANTTLYAQYRAKSSACELTNIQFSNSAYGAIATLSNGAATVTVPYMEGQVAPSVNESSIVISEGATYVLEDNTLTVTAEDGSTTGTYTITKTAFTPLAVTADIAETAFSAVPSWISNPYGYDSNKGVKIAKAVDDANNMRIAKGTTRMYLFISAAQTLTLTSGSNGDKGAINVYRNGIKLDTPNALPKKDKTMDIELDPNAPCMIMIEDVQTSGDGGFTKYAITASTSVGGTISASGWNTFSSSYALDLSTIDKGTAYVASAAASGIVTLTSTDAKVAAGTGLMIKGTPGDEFTINTTTAAATFSGTNLLVGLPNGGTVSANDHNYVFGWEDTAHPGFYYINSTEPTLDAGKAYLHAESLGTAAGRIRIVEEENNATGIEAAEAKDEAVKFFENGQLFIMRNGVVYDVTGRVVR